MEALPIIFTILSAADSVTTKRTGGIHFNAAPEADVLPNIVLKAIAGGQDLTHSGPSGPLFERVSIHARAKTPREAGQLGVAIDKLLHGYTGTVNGANVQLIEKVTTTSDYETGIAVQTAIIDVRVYWGRA